MCSDCNTVLLLALLQRGLGSPSPLAVRSVFVAPVDALFFVLTSPTLFAKQIWMITSTVLLHSYYLSAYLCEVISEGTCRGKADSHFNWVESLREPPLYLLVYDFQPGILEALLPRQIRPARRTSLSSQA